MQLLLIQTQVMKVDMESALLQMDQIMRANRLNFSLMAGLPTLLAVVSLVSLGSTSLGERYFHLFKALIDLFCIFLTNFPAFVFFFLPQVQELIRSDRRIEKT